MTLKHKLLASLILLGVVLGVVIAGFSWSTGTSRTALDTVLSDRVLPLRDLKDVADGYAVNIVDTSHKARNGNISFEKAAASVQKGKAALKASWQRYLATDADAQEEAMADRAQAAMVKADATVDRIEAALRSGDHVALDRLVVNELYASIDPVSEIVGQLVDIQIDTANSVTKDALASANTATLLVIALGVIALGMLGAAFYIVTRKVVAPIHALANVIHGLAKHDGKATLPHLDQRDEIGDIARAVDAYLASVLEKERVASAAAAETQQLVTNSLADGLSSLARGDLTHSIHADFPGGYAALKTNFNTALGTLAGLINGVNEGAVALQTGSGEIAAASENLARRTESNAASLEETSAALVEMDQRLRKTAGSAEETVRSADDAIRVVGDGRQLVDDAVVAMTRVSESARGIDEVIEGVDKIAFQTRVLAMNAAVEAGRAGEAGRGFAVVADLVSALALRAEAEAKRARDQLTLTQAEVETAVGAVQRMDSSLSQISGSVSAVHGLLETMASDNSAQSAAISQIVTAVGQMDVATQQNAAMVEQTSAASQNLAKEVGGLVDMASRFRTGAGSGAAAPARMGAKKQLVAA